MTSDPFNPTVQSIAAHHAAAAPAAPLCEMGVETHGASCEEDQAQTASYAVITGEAESRALCPVCTDKAVSAAIGIGESVQAYRLDEGL